MFCPNCGAKNRESAKFCTKCGTRILSHRESQSTDTESYPSVFKDYHHFRDQELEAATPPSVESGPHFLSAPPGPGRTNFPGHERDIAWSLILSLLTCGIYGFVWLYKIGKDIRNQSGGRDPHAGLDLLLVLLTGGIWGLYLAYKYPKLIDEIQRKAGLRQGNLSIPCLLLAIVGFWTVYGLGLISLALMQNELNKIWRQWRGLPQ
jgi:hypothetical protein